MADKTPPEVYTGPMAGYPPHTQSPAPAPSPPELYGNNVPQTTPSPPVQAYAPDSQQQQYSGYTPSVGYAPSQYGAPQSMYGAPPSQYGAPGFGTPQHPPNVYPAYGAPQTQSMYGAPQGAPGAPMPMPMPMQGAPQAMAAPPPVATTPKSSGGARICGIPRAIFWIILLSAVILILGAIGAGLGVGLSNLNNGNSSSSSSSSNNNNNDDDDSPTTTRNFIPTRVPTRTLSDDDTTPTQTSTRTRPSPTTQPTRTTLNLVPTGTVTTNDIECPRDDLTMFTVGSSSEFRVLCGTFIPGTLSDSVNKPNMGECIEACNSDSVCIGVLWWFNPDITANCDMYVGLSPEDAEISTTNYAYGAYDWAFDLRKKRDYDDGVLSKRDLMVID